MTTPADSPVVTDDLQRKKLLSSIRDVPDWPEPGVMFKDVTPLLRDPDVFALAVQLLAAVGRGGGNGANVVAGIEARGFIFGAPVAQELGAGFVPVRKAGKLPHETSAAKYSLEYADATIEVHRDAFGPGDRVLVVDDVLATGGTASATLELVRGAGAEVVSIAVLLELGFLHGRDKLTDVDLTALITV